MQNKPKIKRILVATGIYPPDIGGPAQYAYELEKIWKTEGYDVTVKYFLFERKLPTGIRHIWFLIKSLPSILRADFIFYRACGSYWTIVGSISVPIVLNLVSNCKLEPQADAVLHVGGLYYQERMDLKVTQRVSN